MKRSRIALKVFILPSIVFAGLLWAIVWANGSKEPIDEGKICPTCRPYQRSNRIKEDRLYCEQCYDEYEEKERKKEWLDGEASARFHARIAMMKRFESKAPTYHYIKDTVDSNLAVHREYDIQLKAGKYSVKCGCGNVIEFEVTEDDPACSGKEPNEVHICPLCTHRLFLEMKACSSGSIDKPTIVIELPFCGHVDELQQLICNPWSTNYLGEVECLMSALYRNFDKVDEILHEKQQKVREQAEEIEKLKACIAHRDKPHSFDAGRISRPMTPDEIRLYDDK